MTSFLMQSRLLAVCIVIAMMIDSIEGGLSNLGEWLPGTDLSWHTPFYRNNQWNVQINVPCWNMTPFVFKLYKDGKLISSETMNAHSANQPVDVTIDDTSGPFDLEILVQAEIIYDDGGKRRSKPLHLQCTPWGIIGIAMGFGVCMIFLVICQIQKRKRRRRLPQTGFTQTAPVMTTTQPVPVMVQGQGYQM